ncbi:MULTISPECIES: hypothetical protein [unclassified Mesorhizobium]|uniref:hypothetical protein n=1 Tax=unclassified Mesorhizobium TaxID=325217 RepID=UPI00112EAD03|nr:MULTISPECIES: hypothetical protein [unclassified Mesorhizobium]MBZ9894605.1 hypothetical protein [Mesorhizobium sp. BR1-1-6]TPN38364.1 hypothetical protein FJ979_13430 [Mesorhizobium sp. B1-1-6]
MRTVLMQPNASNLSALARFIATILPFIHTWAIMQLKNIGYGRQNWAKLFYDSSSGFDVISRAVNFVTSRGIEARLYNFPLCTVPEEFRHRAPGTISDWKRTYLNDTRIWG